MKTPACLLLAFCLAMQKAHPAPPPTVADVQPAPGTVTALTQITVTFSAPVANVAPGDLLANGRPADEVTGQGAVYTFTLGQTPAQGTVRISWDAGHNIIDLAEPPARFDETAPGATWQYELIDIVPPGIASLAPAAGVSVRSLTQVEVRFSEPVAGVDAGDLLINGSPASGLSVLGPGNYRFTFPPPAAGPVQLAWAAGHGIHDFAAPANGFAGGTWTYRLDPNLGLPALRLNEFLAANLSGLADEDVPPEPQDWIEIWNYGSVPVDLQGYALTDDPADPGKWTFPPTNLAPGQFLVVFASGKDRRTITNSAHRLHANFQLNPGGEYLALFNAESPRVAITEFAPRYPEQRNNVSYGYDPAGELRYFPVPTPGAANGGGTVAAVLGPPHANVDRGLFDQPFTLFLSPPEPGVTIRFTTDGTEPTETTGSIYTSPLSITNTTTLRAAAFGPNALPSVTVTHSYLFLDQIVAQPASPAGFPTNWGCCGNVNDVSSTTTFPPSSTVPGVIPADYAMDLDPLRVDPITGNSPVDPAKLQRLKDGLREIPTLSIVMKTDDIFGVAGLYQRSADETGSSGTKPDNKKPCSIEMILPDGRTAFATTCGIDLHGNASRNPIKNPKHGFKLHFRGDFGPTTLQYRLFEDSPVEEYDDILLRADFNSSWRHWSDTAGQSLGAFQRTRATRTRDAWMKDSMRAMGGLASHSRFVHLYLNGLYWGTYDISEDPRGTFARNALGGSEADYDLIDQGVVKGGTGDAYNALRNLPAASSLVIYEQYSQYLNLPEFADYMLLHFFMGHQDWATTETKNWAAIRKRVTGPEGVFHYQAWDGECILLNEDANRTTVTGANYPTGLQGDLDDSPEYRLLFADRAHRHLVAPGGTLTPPANIARWRKWQAVLDKAIVAESCRWGDYRRDVHQYSEGVYQLYTREGHWLPENERMVNSYFPNRNAIVLAQLRTAGLYPLVSAPVFNQQGGYITRGFGLTMSASNTVYYTLDGTDPRVYGTGVIAPGAQSYNSAIVLNGSIIVKARALFGTNWSALNEAAFTVDVLGSPLRITEIMYNPVGGDAYEFLELQNVSPTPIDVGQHSIDGIDFAFAPNTRLAPGQIIVLGSQASPGNWNVRYPGVTAFARYAGRLDNGGEKLTIRDPAGRRLWSVDYDDENGWPVAADGLGASLEILDVFGDPDNPANWRARAGTNGSPGAWPPPPPPSAVVLNEVMADNGSAVNNEGFHPDWVELHNPGPGPVNLGGWTLTDDSNPAKFVFPESTIIAAGGYLVVWCDTNALVPGLRAPFGLGRRGDTVSLHTPDGRRVDAIGFGLQLPDKTIGRIAGGWQLTQPTPSAANTAATTADESSLVLNEWLANSMPGSEDWLELHNRSDVAPVALQGLYVRLNDVVHQLSALSFIAPGGHALFFADGAAGPDHLDFNLPAAGGTLILLGASGVQLDRVTYGPQAPGVSHGRWPDGSANVTSFPASPSPGSANYRLAYNGPRLNEVLAINHAAVTNGLGRTPDFVELHNPTSATFDLSGLRLGTDSQGAGPWVFPAGAAIPADGYLVVWFDPDRPASTAAGPVLNSGQSLDGESGEVWLFNDAGQPVDSVVFGFQIADQPIGLSGGQWTLLAAPTPGAANATPALLGSASGLRLNEWSANPAQGNDWFEIYNPASQPVPLAGLYLTDHPSTAGLTQFTLAPLSFIGPKGFVRCIADDDPSQGRNHVNFNLDAHGEALRLASPQLEIIDTISFGAQAVGVSEGRLPDGSDNLEPFPGAPTPAASNYRPLPNAVINEVLAHAYDPLEDAIEIYNPSGQGIDLSGWFLSDNASDPKKFRLLDGTFLPAGGYRVFYAAEFGAGGPDRFALPPNGGEVLLSEADAAGHLSGRRAVAQFGAAALGVTLGRIETCHGADFGPLRARTLGEDAPATLAQFRTGAGLFNAGPAVGPVVINEIMYHPPGAVPADDPADEYVELHNFSAIGVRLDDGADPARPWRLRGGVQFDFPDGTTVAPGGYLLVVSFDPATNPARLTAFRALYGVSTGVPIVGPYSGKLDQGGERIELTRPAPLPAAGDVVPDLLVDHVEYADSAPWPVGGDGDGASLQRGSASAYGNDAANWLAAGPTPGRLNVAQPPRPPSVVTPPISRAVRAGSRVIFSASACGSAPLFFQWQFNGAAIDHATNAAHVMASVQEGQVGSYRVLISNGAGSVLSEPASLQLLEPPVITGQPQSQAVGGGLAATLTVEATGSGPLAYQWRRHGIALAGATNATLLLPELRRSDAGDYSVWVMNPAGAVASRVATLTVLVPPTFTLQPLSQIANTNTTVTFTVAATGSGPVRYQWQFNGENLAGATNATLVLNNVNLANEGDYRVLATDDVTTGRSQLARLTVRVPPTVLVGVRGTTNVVGSTITLSVTASGSLPMGFSWRRASLIMTNLVLMTTTSTYTIVNAQTNDSGVWRCVVTNSGNVTPGVPSQASVLILAPPVITSQPQHQAVDPGAPVFFTVTATGSALRYQWLRNGAPLPAATNATHAIAAAQPSDAGDYRVIVYNAAASTTSAPATLTVGAPAPLRLGDLEFLANGQVRLSLSGPPNRTYAIEQSPDLLDWIFLGTLDYTNGLMPFVDTSIPGTARRFYRARSHP